MTIELGQSAPAGRLIRRTAVDLVTDELRSRILSGALAPGVALRQEALAEELGVSRIPLREAIRVLSSEGLVDVLPHRGAYVSMLSGSEVEEFFELRSRLEPWLMEIAATQIDAADLDRAEAMVTRMDTADDSQWGQLNWQFHELLYRGANRPQALDIVRTLHEKSERYFRFQIVHPTIRQQAHQEHMNIVSLCRQRNAAGAREALEAHIAEAATQILSIVAHLLDQGKGAASR